MSRQRRPMRRSQAVVPFGVGAIVDFPGEALIAAGLDAWPQEPDCRLEEERLARQLGVEYFRQPPPKPERGREGAELPFVRFPYWHFCSRTGCRRMFEVRSNEAQVPSAKSDRCDVHGKPCADLPRKRRPALVPLRFIVACERGHIEDFPWSEWAHSTPNQPLVRGEDCGNPQLRLELTGQGGLAALRVRCESCGLGRPLRGAGRPEGLAGLSCRGSRPWLGIDSETGPCDGALRMIQRGASNAYFARVASSLLIPSASRKIDEIIGDAHTWQQMMTFADDDGVPAQANVNFIAGLKGVDADALYKAVARKAKQAASGADEPLTEEEYRHEEYRALLSDHFTSTDQVLVTRRQNLADYEDLIGEMFGDIVLVEKLAETRALTGFGRIDPPDSGSGPVDWNLLTLQRKPWLPAFRVFGEGIFLTLNYEMITRWAAEHGDRARTLVQRADQVAMRRGREPRHLPPEFVYLHTLSHLLIRRLSFECGYGTSSLRERLYCRVPEGAAEGDDGWMCGVLIYTAAGDAEGTMGGLVRQGRPGRFELILRNALTEAEWCSSDPLCRESEGQGTDSLNLAACHACALLPETSCEEGNRLLDRSGSARNPSSNLGIK